MVTVCAAPLPFGAVIPGGRLGLELGAAALLVVWVVRAWARPALLPGVALRAGLCGMLALAALQILPLGALAGRLSPGAAEIRARSLPPPAELEAERRLLGVEPRSLESAQTLSVAPGFTASALRTGAALAALLLVACTVAGACGMQRIAVALLLSASLQSLYGILVLASDEPRIWHAPKQYYLGSATGTFVNRNHFACFLAMGIAAGTALILHRVARAPAAPGRGRLLRLLGAESSRNLLLGLLLVLALAGLLTSFSRAGIALGLGAFLLTLAASGRFHSWRLRAIVALLVVTAATVPLARVGPGQLLARFESAADDFTAPGGRATVWGDALAMVPRYPWFGTGYGTFAAVYPLHRSPEVRLFYAHVHNDLLQALVEGGAIGFAFLLLVLVPTARNLAGALRGERGVLAVGLAAGLLAMLLHGLVDFNAHIPANAAMAAILAGSLEGLRRHGSAGEPPARAERV